MQDSGVEWIGAIPQGWRLDSLKRLLEEPLKYGANEAAELDDRSLPRYIRITDFNHDGQLKDSSFKSLPLDKAAGYYLKNGDVLFARSGATVGKTFIFYGEDKTACFAGYLIKASTNSRLLSPEFLYFYTKSSTYDIWKDSIFTQATIQNIGADKYAYLPIIVPPISEQQAIANYLDQQCTKLDAVIAIKQQQIKMLDAMHQSVIYQGVTKGLDASAPLVDSGVEWLGDIPANWKVQQIKRRCELLRGKFSHRPRNDPAFYNGDYPFVQTGDVTSANKYIKTYTQTLNELGLSVSKMFPRKTLVMTIAANVGDVAILNFDACFPDSLVGLVPYHDTHLDFVYYLMLAMKKVVLSSAILTTQLNLNNVQIGTNFAPFPPLSEQRAIADHLDQETQRLNTLKANLNQQISTLEAYKKSLIYECVTGKKRVKS